LQHPVATQLFEALSHADVLVQEMRDARPTTVAAPASAAPSPAPLIPPLMDDVPLPVVHTEFPARTGIRGTSVPAVLLGLGALCLLVAAVTFLAVAWSWLGIGGRTAVLVGLTAVTGGAGLALGRRDLRIAAESLISVSLGLVTLDLLGAENAGWLGAPSSAGLVGIIGTVLAAAAAGIICAERTLVVPQLAAVGGLFVAATALPSTSVDHPLLVAGVAVVAFVAIACAGWAWNLSVTLWAALVAAALSWCDLVGTALLGLIDVIDGPGLTLAAFWSDSSGWALATSGVLLLAPAVLTRNRAVMLAAAAAAASMLTGVVAFPTFDDGATRVALASLIAAAVWTATAAALPRRQIFATAVPAALSLLPGGFIVAALIAQSVAAALTAGSDLTLSPDASIAHPVLLVPLVLTAAALVMVVVAPTARRTWIGALLAVAGLAGVATLALYAVPLWTVVAALWALASACAVDGLRRPGAAGLLEILGVIGLLVGAGIVSAPSAALVAGSAALLTLLAAAAVADGRFDAAKALGCLMLPVTSSVVVWSGAEVVGVDAAMRGFPVLIVVGALALARPRPEVEVPAALVALVASSAAIDSASNMSVSLAIHLTLAGSLVTTSSLVHPSRRWLGWAGGVLLMLATWVRLADLGVSEPEAYTLPTALALTLVGLRRMRSDLTSSTARVLLPGLMLATVPTLLHVIATDPVSLRAAVLGVACLALVLVGSQLKWSAPLLVGAIVGGALTLVELAPYAAQTPQWVLIGIAGTVLTLVGVTWERRVKELHRAADYAGRLR